MALPTNFYPEADVFAPLKVALAPVLCTFNGKATNTQTERLDFSYMGRRHEPATAIGLGSRTILDKIYLFDVACRGTSCDAAEKLVDALCTACEHVLQHSWAITASAPTDSSGETSVGARWSVTVRLEVRGPLVRIPPGQGSAKVEHTGFTDPPKYPNGGDVTYPPTP